MAETPDSELVQAIADLHDEVRVLRDALDEMRVLFEWAVRNGTVYYVEDTSGPQHAASPGETTAGNCSSEPIESPVNASSSKATLGSNERQRGLW